MIGLFAVHMPYTVDKPLLEVLHSGYIGQGKKVEEFEAKLAARLGTTNVLSLNSGTSAILLALRLAGVKPGDEVITTPMTCMATNEPIMELGATPVWADIDPVSGLIDPTDVARKMTSRTSAVVCVDWGGTQCDIEGLKGWCDVQGIPLIEDAAHGFGTTKLGADFICYSFQAIKHITTVDGGALICAHPDAYKRGKLLRWYGIDRETDRKDLRCEEDVVEWGYKAHMNDVAATIGIVQLDYLDGILKQQKANARFYWQNIDHDVMAPAFTGKQMAQSGFWLYTLLAKDVVDRENFRVYMESKGIMASRVHVRNDVHTVFQPFRRNLPGVEYFADREIAIPVHWKLTEQERDQIVEAVNSYRKEPVGVAAE